MYKKDNKIHIYWCIGGLMKEIRKDKRARGCISKCLDFLYFIQVIMKVGPFSQGGY